MDKKEVKPSLADTLAREASKGFDNSEQLQNRLLRLGSAKNRALNICDYIKQENIAYLTAKRSSGKSVVDSVEGCASWLHFRHYPSLDVTRLHRAYFCKKHLLCPACAIRRGTRLVIEYEKRYKSIIEEFPNLSPYFVTLTVKDGPDLLERNSVLNNAFRKMMKYRGLSRGNYEIEKAHGGVYSREYKRGKNSNLWHPHTHAIWLCSTPPNQKKLSEEWHSLTGDSFIVDVRPINQENLTKGFLEVFKYAVKFSDQSPEDTIHCYEKLSKKRLVGSFGLFRNIPDDWLGSDDKIDDADYIDLFFSFCGTSYKPIDDSPI